MGSQEKKSNPRTGVMVEDDIFKAVQTICFAAAGLLLFPSILAYKVLQGRPTFIFEKSAAKRKGEGLALSLMGLVLALSSYYYFPADHRYLKIIITSLGVNAFLIGGMWFGLDWMFYGIGSERRLRVDDLKRKVKDFTPVSSLYDVGSNPIPKEDTSVVIGICPKTQRLIKISRRSRTMHCLFPGASGFGKTTLLKVFLLNSTIQREPSIIIDAKGSQSNLNEFRKFLKEKGLPDSKFYVFSLTAPTESDSYNPIGSGSIDEKRDRLINALNWSEVYYRDQAVAYLTQLFPVLDFYKQDKITLSDIREFMTESEYRVNLQAAFHSIHKDEYCPNELAERIADLLVKVEGLSKWDKDAVSGLSGQMIAIDKDSFRKLLNPPGSKQTIQDLYRVYRESCTQGEASKKKKEPKSESKRTLELSPEEFRQKKLGKEFLTSIKMKSSDSNPPESTSREIILKNVMEEGGIVYFQLSTLAVTDSARRIGKLILEDLKWITAEINAHKIQRPEFFPVYIDEFGEFASTEFPVFLEQAREAKIAIHMFFQGVGNLKSISEDFPERMYDSTCVKGFMSTSSQLGADAFSSMTGTVDTIENSQQVLVTPFLKIGTGMGNQRETKQMRVEHDVFKQLGPGQMVIVDKLPEFHVDLVQVWNPSEEKKAEVNLDQGPWPIKTLGSQSIMLNKTGIRSAFQ